mmetsp:Transcript_66352/g.151779  ORF Transcript_66352/g.151779 Transcript_66352/m.151779 type:complete len:224 (-) Transcript_66352:53-724(-)
MGRPSLGFESREGLPPPPELCLWHLRARRNRHPGLQQRLPRFLRHYPTAQGTREVCELLRLVFVWMARDAANVLANVASVICRFATALALCAGVCDEGTVCSVLVKPVVRALTVIEPKSVQLRQGALQLGTLLVHMEADLLVVDQLFPHTKGLNDSHPAQDAEDLLHSIPEHQGDIALDQGERPAALLDDVAGSYLEYRRSWDPLHEVQDLSCAGERQGPAAC